MGLFDAIRRSTRKRAILKEAAALKELTVGGIMTKYVITVRPDEDVVKTATKMIAEDISCLIVAQDDKPLGIISERDFLRKVPLSKDVFAMKARDIMSASLVTVPPTMRLQEAVALMKSKGIRRLVVMDGNRMLGVVTQTDFTRTLAKTFTAYPVVEQLTVGHIMTKSVITVTSQKSVAEAKQKMLKADVGAILITDKDQVAGIFTEYDIVMQFYDQHGKLVMNDIAKYMRKYVRAVPPQTSIFAANKLMLEKNMRRLLIVDGTKVLGIMTQTDVCRHMYANIAVIEQAAQDPKAELKRFMPVSEIHGEFHGEHLKVYDVE